MESLYARAHGGAAAADASNSTTTTTTSSTALPTSGKAFKADRSAHRNVGMYLPWWIITGVVGLLCIIYLISLLRARMIRRRVSTARRNNTSGGTTGTKVTAAAYAMYANFAHVRVFPLWIYSFTSASDIFWTAAYTGITIGITWWAADFRGQTANWMNLFGYMSFAQMPFIVGLASKNNVLSFITGISYEKFNFLHRAAGRVALLGVAVHVLGWAEKGVSAAHGPGTEMFAAGVLAAIALFFMYITSFAIARRVMYEAFLLIHISMGIIYMVGCYFHWPDFKIWIWVSMLLWGLDRLTSLARLIVINLAWVIPFRRHKAQSCTVEVVDSDVVRVTFKRPIFRWNAGQHANIIMPGVATLRYERHPFTMANEVDPKGEGKVVFLCRAQRGFTRRLINRAADQTDNTITAYLEGPYGTAHDMNHFDTVVLVAGGSGITYAMAHLCAIVKASREGTTAVSNVQLVWNVRHASCAAWITPIINETIARGTGSVRVTLDIYVTSSALADEPGTHASEKPAETPMDTPGAESPSDSVSASSTDLTVINEKKSSKGMSHKLALSAGFNSPAAELSNFHRGRSHLEGIVRTAVDTTAREAAGVAVAVCGPDSLSIDARRAVCEVNSAAAILRGQAPIEFISEVFGW